MARFGVPLLIAAASLTLFGRLDARQIFPLTYEELFKQAEVVVIANAVSTVDAGKDVKNKENNKNRVAVLSTLNVIHVVKGKHKAAKLVVFHYRFTERGRHVDNGPSYLKLDTSKREDASGSPWTAYLLFLKKRPDGSYECVTGQTDPVLSVKQVTPAER